MNTKKLTKIVTFVVIISALLSAVNMVLGVTIPTGTTAAADQLSNITSNVIGIAQFICYAAAVIMLMGLGIKYITAAPEAKADIKKMAVYYVIGAILVFAAGTVLGVIQNVGSKINSQS